MNNAEGRVYDYCLEQLKKYSLEWDKDLQVWYCDALEFISEKQMAELRLDAKTHRENLTTS